MPMRGEHSLERMIDAADGHTDRAARDMADAGTDRLHRNIARRTPIDTNPYRHKPERPRGSLKRSVRRLPGIRATASGGAGGGGPRLVGTVYSDDPVFIYVDLGTREHTIRARDPNGFLRFRSRTGYTDAEGRFHPPGSWVSVEQVTIPARPGQHMASLGALDTEREIEQWARSSLTAWKRRCESGRFT